jgi:hypothetical protein
VPPVLAETSCRIAASREAKRFGVKPNLKEGVALARSCDDYSVAVDENGLPTGVTLHRIA